MHSSTNVDSRTSAHGARRGARGAQPKHAGYLTAVGTLSALAIQSWPCKAHKLRQVGQLDKPQHLASDADQHPPCCALMLVLSHACLSFCLLYLSRYRSMNRQA